MQQSSVAPLRAKLKGENTAGITAENIELAVGTPPGTEPVWGPVDSYDPATRIARALYGPGTPRGPLPAGESAVQARITDGDAVTVTDPLFIYVRT